MRHPAASLRAFIGTALATVMATMCTPFHDDGGSDAGEAGPSPGGGARIDGQTRQCDLNAPFGAPKFVPGLTDAMLKTVGGLRFSADGLTGYFSGGAIGYDVLYTAKRTDPAAPLGSVSAIPGLALNADELDPTVGPDELTLIYSQSGGGSVHLQYLVRETSSMPFLYVGLLPNVNDMSASDDHPFLRENGETLYFSSTRGPSRDWDIYRASGSGSTFGASVPVPELNSPFDDYGAVVTPDDLTVYFSSTRPSLDASVDTDIWMATRESSEVPFSEPTRVSELSSEKAVSIPTFVSRDGCTLYFSRGSLGGPGLLWTREEYVAEKPAP